MTCSQENSANWAGNVSIGGGYTDVSSDWYFPAVTTYCNAIVGEWVGLDGDSHDGGDGHLVQAGFVSIVNSNCAVTRYAWIEDYPNGAYKITALPVQSPDLVYAEVKSTGGHNYYWLDDWTTGNYTNPSPPASDPVYLSNGSTAEWIIELPGGFTRNLAYFNQVMFYNDWTVNGSGGHYVGQTSHNYSVM